MDGIHVVHELPAAGHGIAAGEPWTLDGTREAGARSAWRSDRADRRGVACDGVVHVGVCVADGNFFRGATIFAGRLFADVSRISRGVGAVVSPRARDHVSGET